MYDDFFCARNWKVQHHCHSFLQMLLIYFYCSLCHVWFVSLSHSLWLILSLILLQLFYLSQAFYVRMLLSV